MKQKAAIDLAPIDDIIASWDGNPEFVIEMLQDIQQRFDHLPIPALQRISKLTHTDMARLYHIATFYKVFSLSPRTQTPIQVCTGTACHVRGSHRIMEAIRRELNPQAATPSQDKPFRLEGVRCLGCCAIAPVVAVGKTVIGDLDSSKVPMLLRRYHKGTRKPFRRPKIRSYRNRNG